MFFNIIDTRGDIYNISLFVVIQITRFEGILDIFIIKKIA